VILVRIELVRMGLVLDRIRIYIKPGCLVSVESFNHVGHRALGNRCAQGGILSNGQRGFGCSSTIGVLVKFPVLITEVYLAISVTTISPQCPQHHTDEDTGSNQTNHQKSAGDSTRVGEKPATNVSDRYRCKQETYPCFAVPMPPEPEPPEGLEITAVTVTEPSEPVTVNAVGEKMLVLGMTLVAGVLVEEESCVDWLVEDISCEEENC
jgi:hypothetical protein